jgi:hypothetical protein
MSGQIGTAASTLALGAWALIASMPFSALAFVS